MSGERTSPPHVDPNVLHAPGSCARCDQFPGWQALRAESGVNFTGQYHLRKAICPAERNKPYGHVGAGNQVVAP